MITVREAVSGDAGRLAEIYSHYVRNTAVSFEYEPPTAEEFAGRMKEITGRYPFFVVEKDGVVMGYAYARELSKRAAYDHSSELTIYLLNGEQRQGMGRLLYERLEEALEKMGICNLYACIAYPETEDEYLTRNSAEFHKHLGFNEVGKFHNCGLKFGRWYHVVWMEKLIGKHNGTPELKKYSEI